MITTRFKLRLPDGSFYRDEHGEEALFTMGGKPDDRIAELERRLGGKAEEIFVGAMGRSRSHEEDEP